MNKGNSNHYTLLLQDESDGVGLEDEEEEVEDGLNGIEEDDEDDEDEEDGEEEDEAMEDSEEEELFSSNKHRSLSHHDGANLNGQNHLGGPGNEYRLLNNESDLKGGVGGVLEAPVTIWTPTPMSPARRACFIASIMLGVLVVATFLWVLPCDVQPCEGPLDITDHDWIIKIEGEGISRTVLVRRLAGGSNVLLTYYTAHNISSWDPDNSSLPDPPEGDGGCRDCVQDEGNTATKQGDCGLLMLDGNLGRENWRLPLHECPIDLQCDLLDVSGDQVPECIVRGPQTMVFLVEARYGRIIWHLHSHPQTTGAPSSASAAPPPTDSLAPRLLQPGPALLLPDLNNDTFGELLFPGLTPVLSSDLPLPQASHLPDPSSSTHWGTEATEAREAGQVGQLVLVCGSSGSVLGTPLTLSHCQAKVEVALSSQGITYTCQGHQGQPYNGTVSLNQLLGEAAPTPDPLMGQHEASGGPLGEGQCWVEVSNTDACPSCEGQLVLRDERGQVLLHKKYHHSAVVSWAPMLAGGKCVGVVLKVWDWRHISSFIKATHPAPTHRTTRVTTTSEEETAPHFDVGHDINDTVGPGDPDNTQYDADGYLVKYPGLVTREGHDKGDSQAGSAENLPTTTLESPRTRRNFLHLPSLHHPASHRHRGRQLSSHEDHPVRDSAAGDHRNHHPRTQPPSSLSSPFPMVMRTLSPTPLTPPGFVLQQIHERLELVRNNGTAWHVETLQSLGLGITQLCDHQCLPSIHSHNHSVGVHAGVKEHTWQLISSTTTYTSTSSTQDQHPAQWTLTSIVRKILVYV